MKTTSLLAMAALLCSASAYAAQDKYHITVEEHTACDKDAEALCSSAYPDEDQMLNCMRAKRSQLQPLCLSTFEAGMRRRHLPL